MVGPRVTMMGVAVGVGEGRAVFGRGLCGATHTKIRKHIL